MPDSNDNLRTTAAPPRSALDSELSAVLGAYLGDILEGKRVAILGDASSALGEQVAESSGRRVHVFDPDPRRTAEAIAATKGSESDVRHSLLEGDAELGLASFDVILIPDLTELAPGGSQDARAAVALAERMLAPRGFVAVAVPRGASTVDYVTLFELVSDRFSFVKMLGAAPFVGVTVAEFGGEDEPTVAFDSTLLAGSEEPIAYLAIGSRQAVALDPYLVVQLGWEEVLGAEGPPTLPKRELEAAAQREALAAAESRARAAKEDAEEQRRRVAKQANRLSDLEAQLEEERRRRRAERVESERAQKQAGEEQQRELDAMLERIAELEADLDAPRTQPRPNAESEGPPTQPRPGADPNEGHSREASDFQLSELRKALAEVRRENDVLKEKAQRTEELEAELRSLTRQLKGAMASLATVRADESSDEAARELDRLEERLRERGERVSSLEADLREAERIGRELVREVTRLRGLAPTTCGESRLGGDGDTARSSRLEAELEQLRWRSAALERELAERATSSEDVARLEAALRRAHEALEASHKEVRVGIST